MRGRQKNHHGLGEIQENTLWILFCGVLLARRCGKCPKIHQWYQVDNLTQIIRNLTRNDNAWIFRLDDRIVRTDWDAGFVEGRQYGRGKSGGQVRDEYRTDYDAGRGGYGQIVKQKLELTGPGGTFTWKIQSISKQNIFRKTYNFMLLDFRVGTSKNHFHDNFDLTISMPDTIDSFTRSFLFYRL